MNKQIGLFSILWLSVVFASCSNGQVNDTSLSPVEFAEKLNDTSVLLIDVRTPAEYLNGHISNSINIDWNGNNFKHKIAGYDKSKPVFVYCLSGGRSSSAAASMKSQGFKEVYELKGGISQWRNAGLPETTQKISTINSITKLEYQALLNTDKLVLIDFYAEWCAPCKQMESYLNELKKDMSDSLTVIRIDADDNRNLFKELNIKTLPTLLLYHKQQLLWTNEGYISKEDVLKHLKQ